MLTIVGKSLTKILRGVVNTHRTQGLHKFTVPRRCGGVHLRPGSCRQLNRHMAHPASASMNEDALACSKARHLKKRLVCGESGKGSGPQLLHWNIIWGMSQLVGGNQGVLRVGVPQNREIHHPEHSITHREPGVVTRNGGYHPGNIPAQNYRFAGICQLRGGAQPFTGGGINRVHTRRLNPYHHMSAYRLGDGNLRKVQHLRPTPLHELHLLHGICHGYLPRCSVTEPITQFSQRHSGKSQQNHEKNRQKPCRRRVLNTQIQAAIIHRLGALGRAAISGS